MKQNVEKPSYSNDTGKYQDLVKKLQKEVPATGPSDDPTIEFFRNAQNIYHDMYNNGMMNCVDGSRELDYQNVNAKVDMGFVADFMGVYREELLDAVENEYDGDNSKSESMYANACHSMDLVMDRVIEWIISTGYFEKSDVI